jgi:DNA helicase-2/ATP-dependent DNA helicase PcrA
VAEAQFPPLDLSQLNPQQRDAVLRTEGPLLVLAGAGSGKTRVIAHRVVHLLDRGVPPRAILAVTFTNKAAAEMRERIALLAGAGTLARGTRRCRGLTVSTSHAFGVRVLREHHERLGLPQRFAIFDTGDQAALVKRLLRDLKVEDRKFDVPGLLAVLSRKRAGEAASEGGELARGRDPEVELVAEELLPRYELGLRAMGAVDFDDLLLLPVRLLREDREAREALQRRYRYLLVDEVQDTSAAQFELLELLAGLRRNLCVVGDDDQSIYAWRGAQVHNVLRFEERFPGAAEVFLEQNYRSAGAILDAANAVIGKNPGRKEKRLWTDRGRGPNLRLAVAQDDDQEARWIADEVLRLSFEEKISLSEIALLYRTNAQARPLEEALRLAGVRYRVVGGTSLFDRKEVRDLLAYLRAALNPRDEMSLLRIINVPARGIGDQTVARALELSRKNRTPVLEVLRRAGEHAELAHAVERISAFVALLDKYGGRLSQRGFSQAARELCEEADLHAEARRGAQSGPAQARRVEALEGVLRQLVEFEKRAEEKAAQAALERAAASAAAAEASSGPADAASPGAADGVVAAAADAVIAGAEAGVFPGAAADDDEDLFAAGLPGYLARLALDSREEQADRSEAVTLMTLHAAKGLEWRAVFLCGLEEGLLPHSGRGFDDGGAQPSADGAINLAEERRLCYVGMTRARERLVLTRCRERLRRGKPVPRTPSRFLDDLPPNLVDVLDLAGPQPEAGKEVREEKARNFFAAMDELLGENKD